MRKGFLFGVLFFLLSAHVYADWVIVKADREDLSYNDLQSARFSIYLKNISLNKGQRVVLGTYFPDSNTEVQSEGTGRSFTYIASVLPVGSPIFKVDVYIENSKQADAYKKKIEEIKTLLPQATPQRRAQLEKELELFLDKLKTCRSKVDSKSLTLSVISTNLPPVAALTAIPVSGKAPLNIIFDGTFSSDSDGVIHEYKIDFGDGTEPVSSSNPYIPHIYNSPGSYSAALRVKDNKGFWSDDAFVSIHVLENLPPTLGINQSFKVENTKVLNFSLSAAIDPEGRPVNYHLISIEGGGSVTGCLNWTSSTQCIYTPVGGQSGTIQITYKANDGLRDSIDTRKVSIQVIPENSPPVLLGNQQFTIQEDNELQFSLNGASDSDNDPLMYSILSFPGSGEVLDCLNGTSDLTCRYVPVKDFSGDVSFVYKANDGMADSVVNSTVTITVVPVNDRPEFLSTASILSVEQDTAFTFTLPPAADIDSQTLTYSIVNGPSSGSFSNCLENGGLTCSYTPEAGFGGEVTFSYKANDGELDSLPSEVKIFVNKKPVASIAASTLSGDAPLLVTFDGENSSDEDGYIKEYSWTVEDGGTDELSGPNVRHLYETPGTYTVTLTVYDDFGLASTATEIITVTNPNVPPIAEFTVDHDHGPPALDVSFNAGTSTDSDGSITSYSWDFGDGSTGEGQTIVHRFFALGTYKVSLTIADDRGGTSTKDMYIYVKNPPCLGALGALHPNGGGFVASTAVVDSEVFLDAGVEICNEAKVKDQASIKGLVKISNSAEVSEQVQVEGPSINGTEIIEIYDSAIVRGEVILKDNIKIFGNAVVEGQSVLSGNAQVYGEAHVQDAVILESAKVFGSSSIIGDINNTSDSRMIFGNAQIFDNAKIEGRSQVYGDAKIYGNAAINNSKVSDQSEVYGASVIADFNGISSWISGNAKISQSSQILGSFVSDFAQVTDSSIISHDGTRASYIEGNAIVKDFANVLGSKIFENATIFGSANIKNNSKIHGTAAVGYDVDGQDISSLMGGL